MKISELRDAYYDASGTVSDLVRKLALAGIGVIWIFRVGDKTGGITYFDAMLWPLGLFVGSLAADFLQYLYKTVVWGSLNHYYWLKHKDNDKEIRISEKWNWPAIVLFWSKSLLTIIAYGLLLRFIFSQMQPTPNHALQLTAPAVTAPAPPPSPAQEPRQPPQ